MKFESQSGFGSHSADSDSREIVKEPKNQGQLLSRPSQSKSNYHRLIMLICMLGLVIYAMIEAGKPERWYWLIPPEGQQKKAKVIELKTSLENGTDEKSESVFQPFSRSNDSLELDQNESVASPQFATVDVSDYPTAAEKHWRESIPKLTSEQRTDLYQLLRLARTHSEGVDRDWSSFEALLKSLQQVRSRFHEQLLNETTYSTQGAEKKSLAANELFESEQAWNREELPALTAVLSGKALDSGQRESIQRLQTVLDPIVYSCIEDRTAQGWEGDMPGWERMWEVIQTQKLDASPRVTHLELMAQPDDYRGRPVAVNGWVRGAWKEKLTVKELGIENLYVLAVRPEDSKVSPYFVYLTRLPQGWPVITEKYVELNQRVAISGLFFKIRTYLDTQKKVREAPMILAANIAAVAEKGPPRVETKLLNNPYLIVGGLLGMVGLAVGVALFAFRTTETIRFTPGANRTREINEQLGNLASDPEVKSNRDRIQDLYE